MVAPAAGAAVAGAFGSYPASDEKQEAGSVPAGCLDVTCIISVGGFTLIMNVILHRVQTNPALSLAALAAAALRSSSVFTEASFF